VNRRTGPALAAIPRHGDAILATSLACTSVMPHWPLSGWMRPTTATSSRTGWSMCMNRSGTPSVPGIAPPSCSTSMNGIVVR
jgi:hypothetical protein